MAITIEVHAPNQKPTRIPFNSVPRVGEKIATAQDGSWALWKVDDVTHYQSTQGIQASITVKPVTG